MRAGRSAVLVALCASLFAVVIHASPAFADDDAQLGPKPAMCGIGCWGAAGSTLDESRLGYFTLNPTIVHVGQKVTAHWIKLGDVGTWQWPFKGKGCARQDSPTCTFRATAPTDGWSTITIGIGNPIGAADSQNAYAVLGKDTAVIEGYVNDRTGGGVGGAAIELTGTRRYNATTGADGFYSVVVKPGHYTVVPSGGPGRHPSYRARYEKVSVARDQTVGADFTLQNEIDVTLKLGEKSVPADGVGLVPATITVTKYGKPLANAAISLQAQPNNSSNSAARGVLCQAGSRVWPQGSLQEPNLGGQTITTDAHGKYTFDIQVGTVPGPFKVEAWALDGFGQVVSDDISDARDEQTLEETSLGTHSAASLLDQIDAMKGTPATANAPGDPYGIYQLFTKLTTAGSPLGGIAYGYVGSNFGSSTIVYNAATPPRFSKDGNVASAPNGFVFDQFWWSGATDIATAISAGQLVGPLPTLAQWSTGQTAGLWHIQDGDTPPGTAQAGAPGAFDGFGYGYSVPGGCN